MQDEAERVVLIDAEDRAIGTAGKLEAHQGEGLLHRAFSVFLFDPSGRFLLQQRARGKYHFPLLWSNSCCGHPRPGETVVGGAERRVREELGVDVSLVPVFSFTYSATDAASGLTEREHDHVLTGVLETAPLPNPDEVEAVAWWEREPLLQDLEHDPDRYTPWFPRALLELLERGRAAS